MNRFEQKRPSIKKKIITFFPVIIFAFLLCFFLQGIRSVENASVEKQQESLETAIERSISQCYAVEGAYPPSLEYLQEHYGVTYDDAVFFVDYTYYGGNLLPEFTVLRRRSS